MYPWAVVYKEMVVESKVVLWSMLELHQHPDGQAVYALKRGARLEK